MYRQYKDRLQSEKEVMHWYKKRLIRLLIPYYIYLAIHFILFLTLPMFFSGLGMTKSPLFLIWSIFLVYGSSLNWLPILFIQLALLFPFFLWVFSGKNTMIIRIIIVILLTGITVWFTLLPFPYVLYRAVMWVPWSIVLLLGILFAKKEQIKGVSKKNYLFVAVTAAILFAILFVVYAKVHRSLTLIDHKYPPDLFELSYEIAGTFFVLLMSKNILLKITPISKIINFISMQSYQLFFIHYVLLDLVVTSQKQFHFSMPIIMQVLGILVASIFISYILSHIKFRKIVLR